MTDQRAGSPADNECDHCGAMLPPADAEGLRTCLYCGTDYDITPPTADPPPPHRPEFVALPTVNVLHTSRQRRAGGGCLGGIVLILLVGAAIPVAIVLFASDAARNAIDSVFRQELTITGESVLLLPGEPGDPVRMIALTSVYDTGRSEVVNRVARFDGGGEPTWSGPELSEGQYQVHLLSDGNRVYTTDDDEVVALSLADGTEQWRGSLTDEILWNCENCFSLAGDRLLVTASDGILTAFDTETGAQRWTRRFDDTRASTYVAGDRVLMVDGAGIDHRGIVVNPADGVELATFSGSCQQDGSPITSGFGVDDPVIPMADGSVVMGFGSWPACWQRVDLSTGQPRWNVLLPDGDARYDIGRTHDGATLVAQDGNDGLTVIDLATGAARPIAAVPDASTFPIAVTADTVVTLRESSRGSRPWSVAAYDLGDGAERWTWALDDAVPTTGTFGASAIVSSEERHVAIAVRDQRVDMVTVDGDTSDLTVERLDLATGVAAPKSTIDRPSIVGALTYVDMGWPPGRAVVLVSRQVVVVDLDTASVVDEYGSNT